MDRIFKHSILGAFSLALFLATLLVQTLVRDASETSRVTFGYPFGFLVQDFSDQFAKKPIYPWYQSFDIHTKVTILPTKALLSFVTIFLGMEILIFLLEGIKGKIGAYREHKSNGNNMNNV